MISDYDSEAETGFRRAHHVVANQVRDERRRDVVRETAEEDEEKGDPHELKERVKEAV